MEPTNLPAKRLNETSGEDKPQIFRTLRNIDLNLLTIFEAVYVHKGIVLMECGSDYNTFEEVKNTLGIVAQGIDELMKKGW